MDKERLKQISIREVAERVGISAPERRNVPCPFHEDRDPSFQINDRLNNCHCFGSCNKSWDTIALVMETQGLDFIEACKWLEQSFGIFGTSDAVQTKKVEIKHYERMSRPITDKDTEIYQRFYEFSDPLDSHGKSFLTNKGFTNETIMHFAWKTLTQKAIDQIRVEYSKEELEASGLRGLFGCVGWCLIPFWVDDRIEYLRARNPIKKDFRNLEGKDSHLFNFNALYALSDAPVLYVAEGETDTMTLHQFEKVAVGVTGAGQKKQYEDLAKMIAEQFSKNLKVVACLDNDEAGRGGLELARKAFADYQIVIEKLILPQEFGDINDFLTNKRKDSNGE